MAMGIVSNTDFDKELGVLVKDINRGRGNKEEVPESVRKVIAEEAINGVPAKVLEEEFNVSASSISAYKVGATSTASYNNPDKDLKKHVTNVKHDIATSARAKIIAALENITPARLSEAKVRDIAGVAKDMASVMDKMEGNSQERANIQQVILYAPRMKEEDDYQVIDVPA